MALNIRVNEDYRIKSDERNIIVLKRKIIDPKKSPWWKEGDDDKIREDWREASFHRNLDGALQYIVGQQVRESDAETLTELIREIRQFRSEISDLLRDVG